MVPYPVDQSLPLSVNVLIGEHTLVCAHKSLFVCLRESERERESERGEGGAQLVVVVVVGLEEEAVPPACCVCTVKTVYILQLISAHVNRGKNNIPAFRPLLFSVACPAACFGVAKPITRVILRK